ncbi:uncharacterized protein EV154DRAFT_563633 [Mucor mucedo]|uniref:uncharacterized protein n=1 Tax=Mucor mucedo TaxID=29922 RepID=UPI00221FB070|nr:uncharacterized protein EV154DRAFT_563633 [Mucor mucedo]KAI7891146.1 hypothetical protein EV154DRAFT_563633 [Mucor mucedo]
MDSTDKQNIIDIINKALAVNPGRTIDDVHNIMDKIGLQITQICHYIVYLGANTNVGFERSPKPMPVKDMIDPNHFLVDPEFRSACLKRWGLDSQTATTSITSGEVPALTGKEFGVADLEEDHHDQRQDVIDLVDSDREGSTESMIIIEDNEETAVDVEDVIDAVLVEGRRGMTRRLEKNNYVGGLTILSNRANELDQLTHRIGTGEAFDQLLESTTLNEFTLDLREMKRTISTRSQLGYSFKNITCLYHYLLITEYHVFKGFDEWECMEIIVLNDADPVGFMDCRTRGEHVFRVFQLLGMAGILAVEVMTAKAYSRYHRSFEEQLEMLMKHLLAVLMRWLSLPVVRWIYRNIQQKLVVLNQILSEIDVVGNINGKIILQTCSLI